MLHGTPSDFNPWIASTGTQVFLTDQFNPLGVVWPIHHHFPLGSCVGPDNLNVPVLDDRYSNPHGSACGSASQILPLASLNGRYDRLRSMA